ncbi:hypothetical protein GCM10023206_07180 [Acinetobacter puyangensis]|uniref:Helix-turn-helix domain-containing protein n=1 Tax=Acinetobacter puyangensis TaxID=1096779 RepID=A0A240E6H4_9GAMM|nr:helix-turn-helix transcriptional regulator [Acinetobacter puyangensis]SNX44202.1 Helix-turn-helix domain-containing protein [Acinetobacter puyangensis]
MAFKSSDERRRLIGLKLSEARKLAKYTQSEVMKEIFNTRNPTQKNRISEIENGKVLPDAELLVELCLLYGVSCDWILGFTVEPEIDINASRVGILYNGTHRMLSESIQRIVEAFSEIGAAHMSKLPNSCFLELVEQARNVVTQVRTGKFRKEDFDNFAALVKECDIKLAQQVSANLKLLDNLVERSDEIVTESLEAGCDAAMKKTTSKSKVTHEYVQQLDVFEEIN